MYILIISGGFPSEKYPLNGIFAYDQAKALAALGHKIIFAAVDLRSIRRKRKWGVKTFDSNNITVVEINLPIGRAGNQILDFTGKKALRYLYKRIIAKWGKPDVIHAHFLNAAVIAADLSEREKIPLVITEHSSKMNQTIVSKHDIDRAKYAYSKAERIISVSKSLCDMIKYHTGFESSILPNIVDLDTFNYQGSKKNMAEEFVFISVGNLIKTKGFHLLIDAFSEVIKIHPNCILKIFGGGSEYNLLLRQIKEKKIEDKITLLGRQKRTLIAEEFSKSNVFVLPSMTETFGVVYIEAMASGLPVIATQCGGPEDFVNNEIGILVPVNNVEALVNAMLDMMQNYEKYDRNAISIYTKESFSPKKIAGELIEIYQNIINEK